LWLARRRLPDPDRCVVTARGEGLAVRAEAHGPHAVFMPFERESLPACSYLPELDRLLAGAPDDEGLAVGAEREGNRSPVPFFDCGRLLGGGDVPELDDIATSGGEGLAVRAERHRVHDPGMPLEGGLLLAGGEVPELDGVVEAPRSQGLAIGAEGHTLHTRR